MSRSHIASPTFARRFDREGFEPLNRGHAIRDIPLEQVSHPPPRPALRSPLNSYEMSKSSEKAGGPIYRKGMRPSPQSRKSEHLRRPGFDDEEVSVTRMGVVYKKILRSSTITRYVLYVLPLGAMLAVPIVIGASAARDATLGDVPIVWFFLWLECCWCGLWVSKLVAHFLPRVFQALCGIVSAGTRKYASILRALEIPLSLVGWALVSLSTFVPIMTGNPDARKARASNTPTPDWIWVVNHILAASLISSIIFLAERLFIQIITINYHRKQFDAGIKESKHSVYLLCLLYDASRTMFPSFCPEFSEEDAIIRDTIDVALRGGKKHRRSGSSTPMLFLREAGRLGDKVSAAFGNVAHEVTGKHIADPNSAHSVVVEALERNRSSEALARRIWLSFVIEGQDALYPEDLTEVLGPGRETEAEECFNYLDRDGNGDVSLDEMILTVAQIGRGRQSLANSMHDVDEAIKVLDRMLCVVVFIAVIFIFIAFLNSSFVTTLATTGTALLSLSFVFSVSAQEILGSSIFLFVKHPYDIGDRIDLNEGLDKYYVDHISLLFTVFRRVDSHRHVQIPNIILNTLPIENVSRSKAMTEQLSIFVSFDTSLEDIQLLQKEMLKFVTDKDNARDFQPTFEVEVVGIHEMDKLELSIQIAHKSNWANETVRAARRSKFFCALTLAIKKVPIYGPGGGDPGLGSMENPKYSVSISDSEAAKNREAASKEKEGKRLAPSSSAQEDPVDKKDQGLGSPREISVMTTLNERSPALDGGRDLDPPRNAGNSPTFQSAPGPESQEVEEIKGLLRRETTKGRRKSTRTGDYSNSEGSGAVGASFNGTELGGGAASNTSTPAVPRIGITAPSPRPSVNVVGIGGDESRSSEDYGETDIVEDNQRNYTMSTEQDQMYYSTFPPPPPPTMRPRFGPPPAMAGSHQHQHQQQQQGRQ